MFKIYCLKLQGANIRLVVIGQSAHHHIEVGLVHSVNPSFSQFSLQVLTA